MDTGTWETGSGWWVGGWCLARGQVGPLCQMCVMTLRTSQHTGHDNCLVEESPEIQNVS